ncbi:MAG: D-isomer specific 2-hydroxyacid dehydrogenase family protein [bacterium]|nr:D-isomer specific 2-hydroxyacid dehydrogenase family protein [bacterium]
MKILITDSLFIFSEHEKMLKDAGFEIERLDKPHATEDELIKAIKGKDGYILGGIEDVTEKVIDAADKLKAIVFTGIGYKDHIPAWQYATKKGIVIANTPSAPTHAVSEWALTMALAMNRGIFELGRTGQKEFMTTKGLEGQQVGIIGLGHIGRHIAEMLPVFRSAGVSYHSLHRHKESEQSLGLVHKELSQLLAESDVVFLCVSRDAGEGFMNKEKFAQMKDGALLVSFMSSGIVDENALLEALKSGRIRAVSDNPMKNPEFKDLPLSNWYCFNGSNAFNTFPELKLTSDMATQSMINLLKTGKDQYKVN